jgi:hypothetical protein
VEGFGADGNEEEYMHLDDDDLAYLELPTNEEATESTTKQRALMASFKTQRRDESARRLMAAERRAVADKLAVSQQRARQSAYLCNMAASVESRAAAGWRLQEDKRARASA